MEEIPNRGRNASTPLQIPFKGWKDIVFRIKDEIAEDHIGLIAAGVAFYALLALFPAITALIAIGGLLVEPSQIVAQMDNLSRLLPQQVTSIILDQATKVAGSEAGGLGLAAVLGLGLAIYSASKGVSSLIEGLNVAYDEREKRGFVKLTLLTLGLTLLLVFGLIVGMAMTLALPAVLAIFNLGTMNEVAISVVSLVVMSALTLLGLAIIYRFGPSRQDAQWEWVTIGAIVACFSWIVASAGFAFYVGNFGSYNESFGSLAGVIVLLTWLWLSVFIVLLGAEINGEVEAQTRYDTTVGEPKPMGQRGATKADTLGRARD